MLDEETSIQLFKKGEGSNGGVLTGRNCKQNCKLCSAAGGAVLQSAERPNRVGPKTGSLGQCRVRWARQTDTAGVLGLQLYTVEKNSYAKHMSSSRLYRAQTSQEDTL